MEVFREGSRSGVIRWTAEAAEDFKGIRDYIPVNNLAAAIQ